MAQLTASRMISESSFQDLFDLDLDFHLRADNVNNKENQPYESATMATHPTHATRAPSTKDEDVEIKTEEVDEGFDELTEVMSTALSNMSTNGIKSKEETSMKHHAANKVAAATNLMDAPAHFPSPSPSPISALFDPENPVHSFLISIELDGVPQWKVYRDDAGLYALYNQAVEHFPAQHLIELKLNATYEELLAEIEAVVPIEPRPGVKGIDKSPAYPRLAVDALGRELPKGARLSGEPLEKMINLLRVSSEVALQTVGVLLDLPGGTKGYLEIDEEDEKSCENALKMIEKRGWRDILVVEYQMTGRKLRF